MYVLDILIFLRLAVTSPALLRPPVYLNILTFSLLVVEPGILNTLTLVNSPEFLLFLFEVLETIGFGISTS